MKDLIRRPYIPVHVDSSISDEAFGRSIFPEWFLDNTMKNSMVHRFAYKITGMARDIQHEQLLVLSKFAYQFLDITKPYYGKSVTPGFDEYPDYTRFSNIEDILFDDVYRIGTRIKDLGEEEQDKLDAVREKAQEDELLYITEEDIDAAEVARQFPFEIVQSQLLDGETILSGERYASTSLGRTINFVQSGTIAPGVIDDGLLEEGTLITDGEYIVLDPLTLEDSILFSDPNTGNDIEVDYDILGRFVEEGNYQQLFDVDGDGYISSEDVTYLRSLIGTGVNTIDKSEEWLRVYAKYDLDEDGLISSTDVQQGISAEGAVERNCLIIRNPQGGPVETSFNYHEEPYQTYFAEDSSVFGGVFGLDEILDPAADSRIKDGYSFSEAGLVVGINIDRNEVWAGRRTDVGWALSKVIRPEPDLFVVRGMTSIDNVAFVLVYAEDGIPTIGRYAGTEVGLVRIDMLREAIEYTDDFIPLYDIELEEDEEITGICNTDRKDRVRIFSTTGAIHTIQLKRNAIARVGDQLLASQDIELDDYAVTRMFNDIDNYAFNFGITRNPWQTNESLYKEIWDTVNDPAGNDIEGMVIGVARDLGTFVPILSRPGVIRLYNAPKVASISLRIRSISDDYVIALGVPDSETFVEEHKSFLDDTVRTYSITETEYEKHTYEDETYLIGSALVLSRTFMKDLIIAYMKAIPEMLLEVPDFNERLLHIKNVEVEVTYDADDFDGILHSNLVERHRIDLPSVDQLELYTFDHNADNEILPIHPLSELASEIVHFYKLADTNIDEYIGAAKADELIEDLREGDESTWNKTYIDLSFFDERYRSEYIIRKTEYDDNIFDQETVEVEL